MIKINTEFIDKTSAEAKVSDRRRKNYNFHKEMSATLQRMLNAMESDTYIQPHKHENPDKTEVFFSLRGRFVVVEFDDDGKITDHSILDPASGNFGAEIAPRSWHTIIPLDEGTVAYEVKDGPYSPEDDKHFAAWAPSEKDANCHIYKNNILKQLGLL